MSVVVWTIRENRNRALAGVWHEGTEKCFIASRLTSNAAGQKTWL